MRLDICLSLFYLSQTNLLFSKITFLGFPGKVVFLSSVDMVHESLYNLIIYQTIINLLCNETTQT